MHVTLLIAQSLVLERWNQGKHRFHVRKFTYIQSLIYWLNVLALLTSQSLMFPLKEVFEFKSVPRR